MQGLDTCTYISNSLTAVCQPNHVETLFDLHVLPATKAKHHLMHIKLVR